MGKDTDRSRERRERRKDDMEIIIEGTERPRIITLRKDPRTGLSLEKYLEQNLQHLTLDKVEDIKTGIVLYFSNPKLDYKKTAKRIEDTVRSYYGITQPNLEIIPYTSADGRKGYELTYVRSVQ